MAAPGPRYYGESGRRLTGCKVELSLSASGLVNLDWFSKSDPLAVCYAGDSRGNFREVGRTECIKDTLNPRFVRTFLLPYIFHETQPLRIELYDMDNKYTLNEQDFIGEVDVLLSEVVTARGGALTKELKYRRPQLLQRRRGYLTLSAEEWHTEKAADTLSFVVRGTRLRANGKVFFTVLRTLARNTYGGEGDDKGLQQTTAVFRSESIKVSDAGRKGWRRVDIQAERLCRCEDDRPIVIEVHRYRGNGQHVRLGSATTTMAALQVGDGAHDLPLRNDSGGQAGSLALSRVALYEANTFLKYVRGGCEICLSAAIDFTASNKSPADPRSLHFWDPKAPNEYVRALQAVAGLLLNYDSDRMVPLYGYGAKVPPNYKTVSHCFPLTFSREVEVDDIEGVLEAYKAALPRVVLAGPTYLSPVIRQASKAASEHATQDRQIYHILLILTDGNVNIQDMAETKRAIVAASELPMSIIIAGVGANSFETLKLLDSDDALLEQDGKYASRDIVQFVELREFAGRPETELAAAVLEEVPRQFLGYMRDHEVTPNPPLDPKMADVDTGEGTAIRLPALALSTEQRAEQGRKRAASRLQRVQSARQQLAAVAPPLPAPAWVEDKLDAAAQRRGCLCLSWGKVAERRRAGASATAYEDQAPWEEKDTAMVPPQQHGRGAGGDAPARARRSHTSRSSTKPARSSIDRRRSESGVSR